MAIYQYYLALIPKVGLLKRHKQIPNQIEINTENGYFEADTNQYWEISEIDFQELRTQIDKVVDKANWGNSTDSFNWKTKTEVLDNDAWMSINPKNGKINELSFRADLREPDLKFLNEMLDLAKRNEMMLMDRKGNLINPEINELKSFIELSNTFKFLKDPGKFFDELSDGKIVIE